ncbi:MAG: hypothetical protein HY698_07730 [Deltaproteobacteria bacterium]|nr:hypothetical protein [Deltaproteobacteria bacterium]
MTGESSSKMQKGKRFALLLAALAVALAGVGYAGFRFMVRKNPEAMREIQAADKKQQELDNLFDSPSTTPPSAPTAQH